jgi:hypothetical protein
MSVYVDKSRNSFGRMVMCHMIADTLDELHTMANRLGLRRSWFQAKASFPHYDVSLSVRTKAVKAGALEVDRREFVEIMNRVRTAKEDGK